MNAVERAGLARQAASYLVVGALATAAHYALMAWLIIAASVSPTRATVAGALLGSVIGYGLNRALTFRSSASHQRALPRHYAVVVTGMALNAAVFEALHGQWGLPVWVAQVVATGACVFYGFAMMRGWVFREPVH